MNRQRSGPWSCLLSELGTGPKWHSPPPCGRNWSTERQTARGRLAESPPASVHTSGGLQSVCAFRVLSLRFVVSLHRFVECPLCIEKLDQGRFSAAIRIFGNLTHVLCLRQHVGFDTAEEFPRCGVLLES